MARDLNAGATWVIAEGRESGRVGLYHADQGVREDLVTGILDWIPQDKVIFGAPDKAQQAWFVRQWGGREPRQRRAGWRAVAGDVAARAARRHRVGPRAETRRPDVTGGADVTGVRAVTGVVP